MRHDGPGSRTRGYNGNPMSSLRAPIAALLALGACTVVTEANQYEFAGWNEPYHPAGYARAAVHGPDSNLRVEDCTLCHGAKLTGGVSKVSCDDCHVEGWRTECTYCHGTADDVSGAPPRDIDGNEDPETSTFPPHREHTGGADHRALPCEECHRKPTSVLSPGHNFLRDPTVAVAEVDFSGGLSPNARWEGDSCATAYCHGDGRVDGGGRIKLTKSNLGCDGCHQSADSNLLEQAEMSGQHARHLREAVACGDCHADTVVGNDAILDPEKHVNGKPNVAMVDGVTWDHGTCDGTCHNERHTNEGW